MAPLDQYLIADRNAEIALARSAAPESISRDAEIMVLGRHGYETAVKGKNGFVCMVERSWATWKSDDPEFWNPKLRSPNCFNAAAARFKVPLMKKKTELVLAGRSETQMCEEINAAFDKKELPPLEPGAMCYMMSKQGYLNDGVGRWHPHLMFFAPLTEPETWGANLPGSPLIGIQGRFWPNDRVHDSGRPLVGRHGRQAPALVTPKGNCQRAWNDQRWSWLDAFYFAASRRVTGPFHRRCLDAS
jgi:hypothetical protein